MSVIQRLAVVFIAMMFMSPVAVAEAPRILMVVSSHGERGGEVRPGYEFDEFAKAYLVFRDNGFSVDIASPQGGPVEADKFDPEKPFNVPVLADTAIMAKLADTLPTASVDAQHYGGVFVVGGKGAMFDLPDDGALASLIGNLYDRGAVVGAVCHGPAALVDVRLASGDYLVNGRRVNGFTNQEEKAFGKKWAPQFPFMLEDRLIERGGQFQSSPMMLSHVAVDERLITGQNPSSTTDAALAMVRAMGIEPKPRREFRDEKTLALVAQLLDGDANALGVLVTHPDDYQIELIGMYGYYYLDLAEQPQQFADALALMVAANDTMQHPVLTMGIIKAHQALGQNDMALSKARALVDAQPDNEKAQALLASLEAD